MFKRLFNKLRQSTPQPWTNSWAGDVLQGSLSGGFISFGEVATSSTTKPKDRRKKAKPKDVMNELLSDKKPEVDLTNLGGKIEAIEERRKFMRNDLQIETADEDQALHWLKARKKAIQKKLIGKFEWPITTEESIKKLLSKYKLKMGTLQEYHLAIPAEAVDEMEKYVKVYKKISKEKPEILVIADEVTAKKVEEKRRRKDPILLATSPFGRYFHVLGAWDKEVEIMHELFFENK